MMLSRFHRHDSCAQDGHSHHDGHGAPRHVEGPFKQVTGGTDIASDNFRTRHIISLNA